MRIRTQSVLETAAALCLSIALPTAAYAVPGLPDVRTLPNGLTLVILEDHAVPLVAVSLWIHSGSKDEIETSAGYAHFLEHMVQRGTDTVGPFEYQRLARRWGGGLSVRSNYDRTYIALTGVPSVLGDLVDAASAMAFRAALKDSEIDQELGAFNQEIHGYYDEPASVAFLETLRATFPGHPYRVPMLGNLRTLGTLKHDPLFAFYRNLYVPNNMALVLAGDLDPKRAAALAAAAFGERAKSLTLAPKPAPPAAFAGHSDIEKRLNLREPSVNLTFAGPGYRHPDRPAFEVIARALSDAAGSPVQMAVVAEKSGASARVTYYGLEDAGLLYVTIAPTTPQLSYAAARAALQEILALKRRGLKEAELRALADGMVRDERLRAGILSERANALGEAALFGGVRYYWDLPEAWRKLTPADIARVAAKYLVADNFRLVLILPRETPPLPDDPKEKLHAVMDQLGSAPKGSTPGLERALYPGEEASRVTPAAWGNPRDAAGLKDPERTVLDNGLTLVVQEDHRNSLAAVSFFLRAGSGDDPPGKEGLASLLGRLFGARALAYARDQAARRGERPGALPDVQVTRDFTELRLVVSPSGVKPSLALLAEAIRRPALDDASIAAARRANLEALERSSDDPASIAFELFREKVYEGHPYAHPAAGMPAGLQAVNRDDLSAGLARNARPSGSTRWRRPSSTKSPSASASWRSRRWTEPGRESVSWQRAMRRRETRWTTRACR